MSDPPPTASPDIKLACLGGRAACADLLADLRKVLELPHAARQGFWELLGPCLGELLPPDIDERVQRFCDAYGAGAGVLGDAVGAARALVRGASALDMNSTEFAEDVARLQGGGELAALLLAGYDAGKARVRAEIVRASLGDHGKVLEGVDWRIDSIAASHRGEQLGTNIAVMTLRYRKGNRRGRFTFQATPEALQELREVCARLLT